MTSIAVPFALTREDNVIRRREVEATTERIDGILRLESDALVIQWRRQSTTQHVGPEIRTDRSASPVHEERIPIAGLSGATVRLALDGWRPTWHLFVRAADLRAFERIAGATEFRLEHPGELRLPLRWSVRALARELTAELEMMLADRAIAAAEGHAELGGPDVRMLPDAADRSVS